MRISDWSSDVCSSDLESVFRLFQPITVAFGEAAIIAVIGLGVNIASAFLLSGGHGHDHHHGHDHAPHAKDNNLHSAYVHVLADALTSVLAIAALLAGRYLGWRSEETLSALKSPMLIS